MPRYCGIAIVLCVALLNQHLCVDAGFASLNILQHRKLHNRRGIAEQAPELKPTLQQQQQTVAAVQSRLAEYQTAPRQTPRNQTAGNATRPEGPALPVLGPGLPANRTSLPPPPRSKRLDIVLAHYHPIRVQPALDFWLDFLESNKVQQWEPYVFVYCQNEEGVDEDELAPLFKYGGEIVHLPNVGRESHSFLQHIISHHGDLADYTLFSQDIPDFRLVERFERMFDNNTGFLPLSIVGHVDCKDEWLPQGQVSQLYSMLTHQFCPPWGYTGSFEGQFVVSRKRIHAQDWWVYRNLLDLVSAPLGHWIHDDHKNPFYKDVSNPFFGHVLERAWSLMFNCYESWREGNCQWCDNDMHMEGCGTDACQCLDTIPEGMT